MRVLFFLFCITTINLSFAQIDNGKTSGLNINGKIGTIKTDGKNLKKPASLNFNTGHNGFKTAKEKLDKARNKKQQEKELNSKGILTQEITTKQAFDKHIEGMYPNFPQIDMDLGSFHTTSKNGHISSYDFGRFDYDKVQITVNGKRIHNNYMLTPRIKIISFPLKIGINKIEVTALNEGELPPNTGYFRFFDNNNYTIKKGKWLLAKGAKVIAIIIRDEE